MALNFTVAVLLAFQVLFRNSSS